MAKNQQRQTTDKYDGCSSQITNNETNEVNNYNYSLRFSIFLILGL